MTNNIDIKFSGQVELRAAKYLYTGTDGEDCMRALNTNFYNSAYAFNSTNLSASSIGNPQNAFDRSLSTFSNISSTRSYSLNRHRIRPHCIILDATSSNSGVGILAVTLNILNELGTGTTVTLTDGSQTVPISGSAPQRIIFDNLHLDNVDIRRGWLNSISLFSNTSLHLFQMYIYGEVQERDRDKLPPTFGATTIESFTDSFLQVDSLQEGTLVKDGSLKLEPRRSHTVNRIDLTSSPYNIPDDSEYNVLNFNPNSIDRVVNLPRSPQYNHYIRINNLDGAQQIRVNDSDRSTLIQNLSTADGPNTLEAVWANNQWIITT